MQAILEMGREVGRAAHALFPGGVLVDAPADRHPEAILQTRRGLGDASVPALFEAAFEHRGVRVRVDVLERLPEEHFGLREVKASTRVKDEHLPDLAVQAWVLAGCGIALASAQIVHIDPGYVRGEGGIDWPHFFVRDDRTRAVEILAAETARQVDRGLRVLARSEAPEVEPDGHCRAPFDCEFWAHCTADKPPAWHLYRKRIAETLRTRWLETLESGRPWVSADLGVRLADVRPPVWHLDFEALAPAIPVYPGTRPFEAIAFQWSLHRWQPDGSVRHHEFLADGRRDPRPAVAESLLDVLSRDTAPIVVYSPYERRMLHDLAARVPERARELAGLRDRLVDLLPILRSSVYHPAFAGSFSLKSVGPALAPEVRYDDLEDIADGTSAAAAFARIASGEADAETEPRLRAGLLAYCERDTMALLAVHRALHTLSAKRP